MTYPIGNIAEYPRAKMEEQMNQPAPVAPPTPTEKSQVVILFTNNSSQILRFSSLKRGEKAYATLLSKWSKWKGATAPSANLRSIYEIKADMFDAAVDLNTVVSVSFVDHVKRSKFVPWG